MGGGSGVQRGPQSVQSEPRAQLEYSAPGPPSLQTPLFGRHVSKHAVISGSWHELCACAVPQQTASTTKNSARAGQKGRVPSQRPDGVVLSPKDLKLCFGGSFWPVRLAEAGWAAGGTWQFTRQACGASTHQDEHAVRHAWSSSMSYTSTVGIHAG